MELRVKTVRYFKGLQETVRRTGMGAGGSGWGSGRGNARKDLRLASSVTGKRKASHEAASSENGGESKSQ